MNTPCVGCKYSAPSFNPDTHHKRCRLLDIYTSMATAMVILEGARLSNVTLNEYAIRKGWCTWPIDFDIIWVEACEFRQEKEE